MLRYSIVKQKNRVKLLFVKSQEEESDKIKDDTSTVIPEINESQAYGLTFIPKTNNSA